MNGPALWYRKILFLGEFMTTCKKYTPFRQSYFLLVFFIVYWD